MAKEIIDIYIEQGYEYQFSLDFNLFDNSDLESQYTCKFYNSSIGYKTFVDNGSFYYLALTAEDTNKISNNLEEYEVYVTEIISNTSYKLLNGRIHIDKGIK